MPTWKELEERGKRLNERRLSIPRRSGLPVALAVFFAALALWAVHWLSRSASPVVFAAVAFGVASTAFALWRLCMAWRRALLLSMECETEMTRTEMTERRPGRR